MAKAPKSSKKPYRKPRLTSEVLHETAAATCGKANPSIPACFSSPKMS